LNEYIGVFKGMSDAQIHTYITEHIRQVRGGFGDVAGGGTHAGGHAGEMEYANGGWVTERGKPVRIGEAGEEGLIITNGGVMVIPHAQWMGMRGGAMRGYAADPGGGIGGYTPPPINPDPYGGTGDINPYTTVGGGSIDWGGGGGGGGAVASPVAQAAAVMAAQAAVAEVAAQIMAAVPSSAEMAQAVVAPVMAAQAQANMAAKRNEALLQQVVNILRVQGTASDSGRNMREAVQFMGQ
jgi:hypothetical protein